MGQIERQSQAKMDRFIERARYDKGLDEERPSHYFMEWQGQGWNMFDEDVVRIADVIPNIQDVKRQPYGRFFKGVFTDDGIEYIVNYYGIFAVKDELESEILDEMENPTRFDWRNLTSWVKYKRFNFWQEDIVLEMTKGPMMIVGRNCIYDIRQSTSGVRHIKGVFDESRRKPRDKYNDENVLEYDETPDDTDEESDDDESAVESEEELSEEERPYGFFPDYTGRGLPQQEMLSPPVDELEEKMASLSVSSLPPNEQEQLPDATPPVEKEPTPPPEPIPPEYYDRMGLRLPTGILPPDQDARVLPQVSTFAFLGNLERQPTKKELMEIKGDWGLDYLKLTTVIYDEEPFESGIEWLFKRVINGDEEGEITFFAAVTDHFESQTGANIVASPYRIGAGEDAQEVYNINTGEFIGVAYLPDEDNELRVLEFIPKYSKPEPEAEPEAEPEEERPKLKKPRSTSGTKVGRMLAKKKKEKSVKSGVFSFLTGQLPSAEPRRRPDGTLEGTLG